MKLVRINKDIYINQDLIVAIRSAKGTTDIDTSSGETYNIASPIEDVMKLFAEAARPVNIPGTPEYRTMEGLVAQTHIVQRGYGGK